MKQKKFLKMSSFVASGTSSPQFKYVDSHTIPISVLHTVTPPTCLSGAKFIFCAAVPKST